MSFSMCLKQLENPKALLIMWQVFTDPVLGTHELRRCKVILSVSHSHTHYVLVSRFNKGGGGKT